MLVLRLDCGRDVWLNCFDYSRTYGGLMEGRPNAEYNERIIRDALTARESCWGQRKTHVIPPVVDARDPAHPVLPPALLRAWLWCGDAIDPSLDGSELLVIWFAEECHDKPIADVIYEAVRALPWDQLAQDFYW